MSAAEGGGPGRGAGEGRGAGDVLDAALSGSRVIVTGGAGFIGSHLVDLLLERSGARRVVVVDDLSTGSEERLASAARDQRLELVQADVGQPERYAAAMLPGDVVFHLACLGVRHSLHSPWRNHEVNAAGTLRLLSASRDRGAARVIHVSSSEVYGTPREVPLGARHATTPETVYGASKLAGEAYARAFHSTYRLPTVIVRPFNSYGPRSHYEGDAGEIIPRSIVRVLAGEAPLLYGDGSATRDFMYVSDTARAIALLGVTPLAVGRTVIVGTGRELDMRHVCRAILAAVGSSLEPRCLPARPGDVQRLLADGELMRHLTGFQPSVGFEEGLARTVAWFREAVGDPREALARAGEVNWLGPATPGTAPAPSFSLFASSSGPTP